MPALLFSTLIFCTLCFGFTAKCQGSLVTYESDWVIKEHWQEHLPDAYIVNDSILMLVGLNVNMISKSVNFFIRWVSTTGQTTRETEILNFPNPNGYSYQLSSYFRGSTRDKDFLYIIAAADIQNCWDQGEMYTAFHLVKINIDDGTLLKDTLLCQDGLRFFHNINTTAQEDSLYIYGFMGYTNETPKTMLWTMTKDFGGITENIIHTVETSLFPIGDTGSSRFVAGTHYPYEDGTKRYLRDIWYGELIGNEVTETKRLVYFEEHYLHKVRVLDTTEIAFLAFNYDGFYYDESVIYVLRHDTLAWNFYDFFDQEVEDIFKVKNDYVILQSSFSESDDRKDKILLHSIDQAGFPFAQIEFVVPWIVYAHGGIRLGNHYYVFVQISNRQERQDVVDGIIPLEVAKYEYTHIFKFRVNE